MCGLFTRMSTARTGVNDQPQTCNDHTQPTPHWKAVYPSKISTAIEGVDANLCLPQLLALLENPMIEKDWLPDLARSSRDRACLQALRDLWRSLDRPTSGFWRHTYVFCNRIKDDLDNLPQVPIG